MKKIMNKLGTALNSAKVKAGYYSMVAASTLTTVYAKARDTGEAQGTNIVQVAIERVVSVFPWVGAFFVASGVFKLIMAYRGENPEAQTGAAKDIVIGAVLIIFRAFVWDFIAETIWPTGGI